MATQQRMHYFYMHNEARNDAKLATLTDAEFRVWFKLLCLASENQESRGTVTMPCYLLAIESSGGDVTLLSRVVTLLSRLKIVTVTGACDIENDTEITAITFVNFDKRNQRKPSDEHEATAQRKRDQRERERLANAENGAGENLSRDVTPMSRAVTRSHAQSRIDKIRVEKKKGEINTNGIDAIDEADALFAEWWQHYPRKVNRQAAIKAWRAIKPSAALAERLTAAIDAQTAAKFGAMLGTERESYIPHASTWLNGRQWENDIAPLPSTRSNGYMTQADHNKPFTGKVVL